ncbi:MAG: MFS transporter, partial [Chloroflexi bacterium]|nr:MFS transporter [Chloroflexota bacterium]
VLLLRTSGAAAISTFFNVYMDSSLHVPTALIGTLVAASQLLSVPVTLSMPLLVARLGHNRLFLLGRLGMVCAMLPLALISHWAAAGVAYLCLIPLNSLTFAAISIYQLELVPAGRWATMSSFSAMAGGLSIAVFSLGGGYIIRLLNYQSLFLLSAAITTAGILLFWWYFRVPRGELARPPALEQA